MERSYFIGVDLHRVVMQICIRDERGEIVAEKRVRYAGRDEGLAAVEWLRTFAPSRVAVEAMGLNRWFVNACRAVGLEVLVCDPRKLDLKKLGKKTDRRDARELARRLWLGDLDRMATTYYPSDEEYGHRKLLRVRHQLVQMRQQAINPIRGLLNAYQIPAPAGVLYTIRGRDRLRTCRLPTPEMQAAFDALVNTLDTLQNQIDQLSRQIEAAVAQQPAVAAVRDVLPQIGAQSAATLVYELGDARRFRGARAVAAYAGLVPTVSQSADKTHHGRLTKQGNRELRWILSQWAVRLLARDPIARTWAARLRRRMHSNKIRMALARRLLVGVWIMLSRGEAFDLQRCLATV
jgi:transposase